MARVRASSLEGLGVKVALDVSAVPPRPAGAGRYVLALAHELVQRDDLDVTLVSRRGDAQRWAEGAKGSRVANQVPNSRGARLAYEELWLGRSALARQVDVWHGPHYTSPRLTATGSVITIHDLTFLTHPEWHEKVKVPFFQRAIARAVRHADALVTVSEWTARELREHYELRCPVFVAPHGVDLDRFTPDARVNVERPYILFVGTLEPRKGVNTLLEAFDLVAESHPDVDLVLVGQPGWGMEGFEAALRAHRFASRIDRRGYVADEAIATLMASASVVAYPSFGEGFGLPVLEALGAGALVVTTSDTVMEEVAAGHAALVPSGDVVSLATALAEAVSVSETERHLRAEAARRHVSSFTWARAAQRHVQAYQAASPGAR